MSAVICEYKCLRENEIVQYFQNYKCYDFYQDHLKTPFKSSANTIKTSTLKRAVRLSQTLQILVTFNV